MPPAGKVTCNETLVLSWSLVGVGEKPYTTYSHLAFLSMRRLGTQPITLSIVSVRDYAHTRDSNVSVPAMYHRSKLCSHSSTLKLNCKATQVHCCKIEVFSYL